MNKYHTYRVKKDLDTGAVRIMDLRLHESDSQNTIQIDKDMKISCHNVTFKQVLLCILVRRIFLGANLSSAYLDRKKSGDIFRAKKIRCHI